MKIEQFEDENLAHFSYAIISNGEMALIDPARDPQPYYDLAARENAKITTIIETHPHADFVSSHLEIHQKTGADIHVSKWLGALYPHLSFDEGQEITLGEVKLKAWNTPGHSADSISILLEDNLGQPVAVFTGDTLFIGDCGRPDLREAVGAIQQQREEQARQMFHSLRKFLTLSDEVAVYPAHGAGSLCGKGLGKANSSTIGKEKRENWSLQDRTEDKFVEMLTADQPFVPKYFGFAVELNRNGAPELKPALQEIPWLETLPELEPGVLIIDARLEQRFKSGHQRGAINIPEGVKFETWLGSIVGPEEKFFLVVESSAQGQNIASRIARIGYESNLLGLTSQFNAVVGSPVLDVELFDRDPEQFTILDIRSEAEAKEQVFSSSLNFPLHELRERVGEISTDKDLVVHCAGGYRSAIGQSILQRSLPGVRVFDLSTRILDYQKKELV